MWLEIFTNTLQDIWPMLTIFLVVIISIRVTYIRVNHEKFIFYQEFLNLVFVVYALLLFQMLTNTEMNTTSGFNLVPFTEILRYKVGTSGFKLNVIGNILIFLPFGYFVSGYVKATKISHILIVSFFTSATVELVQHFIGRSFDVDDILLNVIGAILGFFLYIGFGAIKKHLPRFLRSDMFYNILCVVLFILAIIYYFNVMGINLL